MGLKDRDKIEVKRGDPRTSWFPKEFDKSAFPIMKQPATEIEHIDGTAFVMYYKTIPYVVTAAHVLKMDNPAIHFLLKSAMGRSFSTSYFNELGIDWIKNEELDLAAIPFHVHSGALKPLHIFPIQEEWWNLEIDLRPGNSVKHLGYPEQQTTNFPDGSPSMVAMGMAGDILAASSQLIRLRTPAQLGASGGPVFVRTDYGPRLIGVASETDVFATPSLTEGEYLGKTSVVPIHLLKSLFDSKEMQDQYANRVISKDMW